MQSSMCLAAQTLVVVVLWTTPSVAIRVHRHRGQYIDEPETMNAAGKVEPLVTNAEMAFVDVAGDSTLHMDSETYVTKRAKVAGNYEYKKFANYCVNKNNGDIGNIRKPNVNSLQACKDICNKDPECLAIEWYPNRNSAHKGLQCWPVAHRGQTPDPSSGSVGIPFKGLIGSQYLSATCHIKQADPKGLRSFKYVEGKTAGTKFLYETPEQGLCTCDNKVNNFHVIFKSKPKPLQAVKAACMADTKCAGVTWARGCPYDILVSQGGRYTKSGKCGFAVPKLKVVKRGSNDYLKLEGISSGNPWTPTMSTPYQCFAKVIVPQAPTKLPFNKLPNGIQTWKVRVSPGRCTNSKVKAACASKGLRPLCDHDAYRGGNCDPHGRGHVHISYPPHYQHFGFPFRKYAAGICMATSNGNHVLYNTGNSHSWENSNNWITFPDGKRIKAWDQDAKGWWTLCRQRQR